MNQPTIRTYSDLIKLDSYQDRFEYLKLDGKVGADTFGFDRYLNQAFYRSPEWRSLRDKIIIRDLGCDLAMPGYEIPKGVRVYIHHMNPISQEDLLHHDFSLIDPEFLICVTHKTHNAIHYGDSSQLILGPIERRPNDTCPWKHN